MANEIKDRHMKTLSSLLLATVLSTSAIAQNVQDALTLSQTESGGTARYMSMGGAFSALGADFSSLSTNPAGIAAYRTSEFTFTPNLNFNSTESNYNGSLGNDSKTNLNLSNLGYVGTVSSSRTEGVVSVSFGVGFNRLKDYTRNYYAHNGNLNKSLTDYFVGNEAQAYKDGYDITNDGFPSASYWPSKLGYQAYLINPNGDGFSSILGEEEMVSQSNFITETGRVNEYVLSMGMNISNKIYLGATMGIQDIYFKRQTLSQEDFFNGGGFTYTNQLKTRGAGINLKLGAIFLPVENVRLGLAIHTPTFMSLDDDYSSAITNVYGIEDKDEGDYTIENKVSPLGEFEYELQTPSKVIAGAAIVIDKRAIFSLDYEMSDYSSMKFSENGNTQTFIYTNQDIKNVLDISHTLKAGIEYRITPEFSIRGGYSKFGSPYKNSYDLAGLSGTSTLDAFSNPPGLGSIYVPIMTMPQATTNLSGGFGYRDKDFFIDFAFIHSMQDVDYLMFKIPDGDSSIPYVADITSTTNRYMVTIGFKF